MIKKAPYQHFEKAIGEPKRLSSDSDAWPPSFGEEITFLYKGQWMTGLVTGSGSSLYNDDCVNCTVTSVCGKIGIVSKNMVYPKIMGE